MSHLAQQTVQDTGHIPVHTHVTGDGAFRHFVAAGGQDMSSGFVMAHPTEDAKRAHRLELGAGRDKPHLKPVKDLSRMNLGAMPSAQLRQDLSMRRPGQYKDLKAMAEPEAKAKPIAPMPTSVAIPVGNLAVRQQPRAALRLVAEVENAPKPAATAKPTQPTYAQRAKYWGQSMGLTCAM